MSLQPVLFTPAMVATVLGALNLVVFAAFGLDKWKAVTGKRRIAEARLLLLALLGGTPGAYAGRAVFRHKTRKQPFANRLHAIAVLQALGLAGAFGWMLGGA